MHVLQKVIFVTELLSCLLVSVEMQSHRFWKWASFVILVDGVRFVFCCSSLLLSSHAAWYSANIYCNVNLSCLFFPFFAHWEMNRCLCPSSVSAIMKRRLDAGSETLHEAKRAHDDSSSDEESQLSRQGRCTDVKNIFRRNQKERMCTYNLLKRKWGYCVFAECFVILLCPFTASVFMPGLLIFQTQARMIPSATRMIIGQDFRPELQSTIRIVISNKPPPVSPCTTVFRRDSW